MTSNPLSELLDLPAEERARIATALWSSLAPGCGHQEFELLPAWERRSLHTLASGAMGIAPWVGSELELGGS
jgi:hypothetical protein